MLKKPYVWLILICLFAFSLRLIAYSNVFGGGYVSFLETDAYNRMYYARLISGMPFFDAINFSFTQGSMLFPGIVALFGKIFPIESVGAWLPPIFGVLTVIIVYAIGSNLFNRTIGLIGAAFVAVIPSEFLNRTQVGYADHHAMEIMLMMLTVYLIIMALKVERRYYLWSAGAGISLLLYVATWKSGLVLPAIMGIYTMAVLVYGLIKKAEWKRPVLTMVLAVAVFSAIWLPTGGYRYFQGFFGNNTDLPMQSYTSQEVIDTALTPPANVTIGELRPIFAPFGSFSPMVVVLNFHFFTFSFLMGLALLWYHRKDKAVLYFVVWTLAILAMTLLQRRFAYYLTIPIGLLSGVAIYEITTKIKVKTAFAAAVLAVPLILVSLPLANNIGKHTSYQMTSEWHDALEWLSGQQVSGHVTAWSDYGHWIKYVTGYEPNALPGPGGENIAKLLLSTDTKESADLMDTLDTDYLIVDTGLERKIDALEIIAGEQANGNTLLSRLLYRNDPQPYLTKVYESQNIKIFEYARSN